MSFLNWPIEEVLPGRRIQQRRRRVVLDLLDKFGRAFPEITYELLWESPTVNAQAWRKGTQRLPHLFNNRFDTGSIGQTHSLHSPDASDGAQRAGLPDLFCDSGRSSTTRPKN
jgi:hypothetical protein